MANTQSDGTILNVNNGPQAKNDSAAGSENGVLTVDVMANDLGGAAKALYSLNQQSPGTRTAAGAVVVLASGAHVSFVNGKVAYDPGTTWDHLAAGQVAHDTFIYAIQMGNGVVSYATVSVTITGTNDAPVAVADVAQTTENALVTVDVLANDTDADTGHVFTLTSVAAPTGKGVASVVGNKLVFNPGADFDHLKAGATEQVVVTYQMKDDAGAISSSTATITVTGTNDGPVVTSSASAAQAVVHEAGVLGNGHADAGTPLGMGTLTSHDVDDGATATWSGGANGQYGVFAIDAAGHWTYQLDNTRPATQALAQGQSVTETFTATVTDDQGATATQTVTVSVVGANDAPVVTGAVTGAATEDGAVTVLNGLAHASDLDAGAHLSVVDLPATLPAGVSFDATTGSFSLDPSAAAYQSLAAGEQVTVTISYGVSDGLTTSVPASVSWTVTGANDAPVVSGAVTGAATEDGATVALSALANASDVDHGAHLSVVNVPASLPDGVTYDATTGTFALDPAAASYQALAAGEQTTVTIGYAVTDGLSAPVPASVSWTITGTNDAPVVSGSVAAAATEDGPTVSLSGLANALDVDHGAHLSIVDVPAVLPDGVSYDPATGAFVLDPSAAAFQSLAAGETTLVSVSYAVTDGLSAPVPATVSWTVTGTNDAPVVSGAVTGIADEDGPAVTLAALANASDVDHGAHLSVVDLPSTLPDGVSYDASTGEFTLDPGAAAYQALNLGETASVSVSYSVSDGISPSVAASVSWLVTGTNDAPVVSDTVTGAAAEDGPAVTLAALANASDADSGAHLSVVDVPATLPDGVSYDPATGSFTLDPSGAAYQSLADGEVITVAVYYSVSDGIADPVPAAVNWTVTGVNDAPVVTGAVTGTATEGGAQSVLHALANASDVDHGAILSVVAPGSLPAGVSFDAATQSFTLDPTDAAYQSLAQGDVTTVTVSYAVTDSISTTPATASWTVTGINNAAVVSSQIVHLTEGNSPLSASGTLTVTDVDGPGTLTPQQATAGLYGTFSIDADGHWNYATPTAHNEFVAGQTYVDRFTVTSTDGSTGTVEIDIGGTNDAPAAYSATKTLTGGDGRVNLEIVLDLSGSMQGTSLTNAKAALNNLLDQYDSRGDVAVRLVTFSTGAGDDGGTWLTVEQARAAIADYQANGSTNYDAALASAKIAFATDEGKLPDGRNVLYFVSDGEPNLPSGSIGTSAAEEAAWKTFLLAQHITSYALGISSASAVELDKVAYDGVTGTDLNSVLVSNTSNLGSVLVNLASPLVGNLLTGSTPQGTFGGDDPGFVLSVSTGAGTITYNRSAPNVLGTVTTSGTVNGLSVDNSTHIITFTDALGGRMSVDMDTGDYTYQRSSNAQLGASVSIGYTLRDVVGATASATLTLVGDGVKDDHVFTNIATASALTIPTWTLLANDTDETGGAISVSSVSGATLSGANVVYPALASAPFHYTGVSANGGTDGATVAVDHVTGTTLTGSSGGDVLVGAVGTSFVGGGGDDRIIGSSGNDTYTMSPGDGHDVILDSGGNDTLYFAGTGDVGHLGFTYFDYGGTSATGLTDLLVDVGNVQALIENATTTGAIEKFTFAAGSSVYGYHLADAADTTYSAVAGSPNLVLIGNASANTLTGGAGKDILIGAVGSDTLSGGGGDDLLIGNGGFDTLTGGAGNDVFAFTSASDTNSFDGTTGQERIMDFVKGQDKISLSTIDADTSLAGDQAFLVAGQTSVVHAHSINWFVSGTNLVIQGDVNGDNVADFTIYLPSQTGTVLAASDFYL